MAIQVRRGNEEDFDPSKMLPGEWAVSLDTKYVRMCFAPGVVLRMATYEAFESDMDEIRSILTEARSIQEAVASIQTEINNISVVVEDYSILSKSYAVGGTGSREGEDIDNAKYYYEQAKHISQGGNGLVPLGSISFEDLPTEDIITNAMYNINNDFTSDERFVDGGGTLYGKGSNIFYTADGKWDVLAASDVKGVKGEEEDTFRQGNVTITADNIGLGTVKQDIADLDARLDENVEYLQNQIDTANSNLDDVKNNPFHNRDSITNIDDIPTNFSVYATSTSTEGTFPDGFSKVGIMIPIRRTSTINIQLYIDTMNNMATRVLSSGTWGEWDIKASTNDLSLKFDPTYLNYIEEIINPLASIYVHASKNLIKINATLQTSTPSTSDITILKMKEGYRPRISAFGFANCYNSTTDESVIGIIRVNPDGNLILQRSCSRKYVVFSVDIPLG